MTSLRRLLELFSLLQLTKDQPLTGYLPAGIKLSETATLAEHHYTATLMGWLLVQTIKDAGGKINERRVVLMLLIHDLGELFGGDIASPLNRKYPDLRQYKNLIGDRALAMLLAYLPTATEKQIQTLLAELNAAKTDEAIIVKILDQIDHQLFLEYHNYHARSSPSTQDYRPIFVKDHVYALADALHDQKTKAVMQQFLQKFHDDFFNRGYQGMRILMEEDQ